MLYFIPLVFCKNCFGVGFLGLAFLACSDEKVGSLGLVWRSCSERGWFVSNEVWLFGIGMEWKGLKWQRGFREECGQKFINKMLRYTSYFFCIDG